jgi:hypothetical protein
MQGSGAHAPWRAVAMKGNFWRWFLDFFLLLSPGGTADEKEPV